MDRPPVMDTLTPAQVRAELRRRRRAAGGHVALARQLRVSSQLLSMVLAGVRQPGPKLLRRLGLRACPTRYVRVPHRVTPV